MGNARRAIRIVFTHLARWNTVTKNATGGLV